MLIGGIFVEGVKCRLQMAGAGCRLWVQVAGCGLQVAGLFCWT